ncbi:hypothetical protein BHE90_011423 [Fusarium euwallaceae]|uniref:F-box domain-containing protein n=5 Tax=Fusarium solani species complex TaxID=232080 RepID=A0A3M2SK95_9HYPO|nr:hypothetical protein CDV36_002346 [Fusarium kuroshium]RSL74035.1 hypothetical protein CEP51_011695 [Fusarium floridanum]RSM09716.1 hypothetical protein CDV31_007556 [Fusarium ambrosium]RSM12953.1 hypothetical protein CEP52_002232 [Fusarium oligoseptatum]RTE74138.1 hypothetical protein BHE90_011423 [Fusarium euwallaceae]
MGQQFSVHRYRFLSFDKGPVSTLDENLPPFPRISRRRRPPSASAGSLDRLPTELLHQTLTHLDIRSLINLRLTNRRTSEIVDYHPQFKAISAHARNALRGILAIGTGRWITCATLYETLCTSQCGYCGTQGGYIYLITCKRVCFKCLSLCRFCHPLPLDTAAIVFSLDVSILRTLPHMTALPGTYAPSETITEPVILVDFDAAKTAGTQFHGTYKHMVYHEGLRCLDRLVLLGIERGFVAEDARSASFAAASRVPWFNKKTRKFEDLSFCDECLQHPEEADGRARSSWRVQYTEASLVKHKRTCRFQGLRLRSGTLIQRR